MGIVNWLEYLPFDARNSAITLIVSGGVWFVYRLIKRPLRNGMQWLLLGLAHHISMFLTKNAASALTLKAYCRRQLAGSSKFVNVPGIMEVNIDIDKIFVPLSMKVDVNEELYNHENVLESGNRIRIIGDPGSGKSSIAKKIFRLECTKGSRWWSRGARFPVLVELRRIKFPKRIADKDLDSWLFNFMLNDVKGNVVYDIKRCFEVYASTAGLLVILDGLDEISTTGHSVAQAAINALSERLAKLGPNNIIILTMRVQFHRQVAIGYYKYFPTLLSLKPFTPTDIYEFLQRWDFGVAPKATQVVRIYTDLTDRPTLREMCANPLILSMYVAQDQATGHPITPETRTDFYKRVTEELLFKRRALQLGLSQGQMRLKNEREHILGRIAFNHLTDASQPANLIPWSSGVNIVRAVKGRKISYDEAENELREISKDTGLISEEREGETLRFIHLTFCEFLAAVEANQGEESGWDKLVQLHVKFRTNDTDDSSSSRLTEVLPFACALLPRLHQPKAISDLDEVKDERVFALAMLETKVYEHPAWNRFVAENQAKLVARAAAESDLEWLNDVHLFTVVCSDSDRNTANLPKSERHSIIDGFFDALSKREDGSIYRMIDSYATQDAAAAFHVASLCGIDVLRELTHVVVKNCDQPPFLAIALEQASGQPDRVKLWTLAIAESGLRSAAVAGALARSKTELWASMVDDIPRANWWSAGSLSRNTWSECLTVANETGCETLERDFPCLFALRQIRPPGARWVFKLSPIVMFGVVVGGITLFSAFSKSIIATAAVVILSYLVMVGWFTSMVIYRRLFYASDLPDAPGALERQRLYQIRDDWFSVTFGRIYFKPTELEARAALSSIRKSAHAPLGGPTPLSRAGGMMHRGSNAGRLPRL